MTDKINITEETHVIDPYVIDLFQKDFKFSHEKGIAEWLKNSADAYNTSNTPDSEQHVFLRFNNLPKPNTFECIDFVGMTVNDIDKALKRWYDPKAAKKGTAKATFGGHGNGGKYYMRGMFETAYFVTYREGKLNIFGFNEKGNYGFAEGYKDKKTSLDIALKFVGLQANGIPLSRLESMKSNKSGFTVVKGISPKGLRNFDSREIIRLCGKILGHPQSRYLLNQLMVKVFFDNKELFP